MNKFLANQIKSLIIVTLFILAIFLVVMNHNESSETITYDYQKEETIINQTGNIWISKITIPKKAIFEHSFVGIVEIVSNNNSDQTIKVRSDAGVSGPIMRISSYSFSESLIIEVPSNSTIVVELKYRVDSRFYSYIANNTLPTGMALYQDEFCQNLTDGRLYLSAVGFDLTITKYSYMNPLIIISVIFVTGYVSFKMIDKKLLRNDELGIEKSQENENGDLEKLDN